MVNNCALGFEQSFPTQTRRREPPYPLDDESSFKQNMPTVPAASFYQKDASSQRCCGISIAGMESPSLHKPASVSTRFPVFVASTLLFSVAALSFVTGGDGLALNREEVRLSCALHRSTVNSRSGCTSKIMLSTSEDTMAFVNGLGAWQSHGQRRLLQKHSCPLAPRILVAEKVRNARYTSRVKVKAAAKVDYYEVLGVERDAPLEVIKKSYYRLALANHPDVCQTPGASDRFQLINEAYSTLSDPEKRRQLELWTPSRNTYRAGMRRTKRFKIGEVVGHKQDGYIGVIVGIDEGCSASDEWIEINQIDSLPGGRGQRFYHLLPDLPNGGEQMEDQAEVLCEAPAFLLSLSKDDEWPTLHTTYVPGDLLHEYVRANSGWDGGARDEYQEGDDWLRNSPVHNPLLADLFMAYCRGRYVHDGRLEHARFYPIAEAVAMSMLWGYHAADIYNNNNNNNEYGQ